MNSSNIFNITTAALRGLLAAAAMTGAAAVSAHVTLTEGAANAGSDYAATLRVGHACKGAKTTTGLTVRLPEGFTLQAAEPRSGWQIQSGPGQVSWKAANPQDALPGSEQAQFVVRGKLADKPGVLWFKVLQNCDAGSADWAQIPAGDGSKPEFPALRLDVVAPGTALVQVSDAWVRRAVPGQSGTGAFMKLKAPVATRLVGATTPVAGVAEVHEMKMEGDTMKMRPLGQGLELPAGQSVELSPGGYHLMLMDLKQPIVAGSSVPLTLRFVDAKGVTSELKLQVPVATAAPGGDAASGEHQHKH